MTAKRPRVAVFCMESPSHFGGLRRLVCALTARGIDTHVFTHRRFATLVEEDGATFVDLFARHTVEEADGESVPFPCRSVSFAGLFADAIAPDVARIAPSLILYDHFAVVAWVVARALGIPFVTVASSHNLSPANHRQVLSTLPMRISPRCAEAVRCLRERHGMADASPLSFASTSSPFLNLYLEPPEFLTDQERQAFEPVAFFGSLPPVGRRANGGGGEVTPIGDASATVLRVYVCFGTVVAKYFASETLAALRTIAVALAEQTDVRALISLGGRPLPGGAGLRRPNVAVEPHVDQWRILEDADVFITHAGRSSVHEAIFHRVPMVTHPFFGDQPGLAARCRELGLAIPLTATPRGPLARADVDRALSAVRAARDSLRERLEIARGWEMRLIAGEHAVVDRLLALG